MVHEHRTQCNIRAGTGKDEILIRVEALSGQPKMCIVDSNNYYCSITHIIRKVYFVVLHMYTNIRSSIKKVLKSDYKFKKAYMRKIELYFYSIICCKVVGYTSSTKR